MTPPTAIAFNPFRPEFAHEAYAVYAEHRKNTPIACTKGCIGNEWVLFRYRDIQQVLRSGHAVVDDLPARIRSEARRAGVDVEAVCHMLEHWLFFIDPPGHTVTRRLLETSFSRPEVERLRARVRFAVENLIAPALNTGRIDVRRDVAAPLPCLVASLILGRELPGLRRTMDWATGLFSVFTQPTPMAAYGRLNELTQDFYDWILSQWRVRHGEPGLLDVLVAESDRGTVTAQDVCAFAAMLFGVGQETTEHLIGNATFELLRHPDQMARLTGRPELMPGAVRELARYDSPVQMIVRRAAVDFAIANVNIRAGERLHLILGSAHRDDEVFVEPDRLDVSRRNSNSLLFGSGAHRCLGSHLALLVAGTALEVILARLPDLRLADSSPPRIRSAHMRGFSALPCTFTRDALTALA